MAVSFTRISQAAVPDPTFSARNAVGASSVASPATKPLNLVYISGAHRSGSTFLGALLGADPQAFFVGEAYRFPRPMFWPPDPSRGCSCGVPVERCPFWTEVRAELERRTPLLERLEEGQYRYERWTKVASIFGRKDRADAELDAHVRRMTEFLRVISAHADAPTLVESSFSAVRGNLYRHADLGGGQVRFLHLVRDGRNFIASERSVTHDPEAPSAWLRTEPVIIGRWVLFNLAAILLGMRAPESYLRVRYEELMRRPEETLAEIGAFLRMDLSDVARRASRGEPIPMRHLAAGNRMRLLGSVTLRSELARSPQLPVASTVLFWTLGGWLALLLGYRPGRRSDRAARSGPSAGPIRTGP
ncbi:MAG: hypothetical protein WA691_02790 [Thermoplasmata archaeon]